MWRVNIYCSGDDWKRYGADFKEMTKKYPVELIVSQKMPDETRIMAYKIEGINEAESFHEDCIKFSGFTSDYESF